MDKTAQELREELARLEAEEKMLREKENYYEEDIRRKKFGKTKVYNGTKLAIVLIIIYLVVVGTFGSMHIGPFSKFNMDDFVNFLGSFSPIFITLTGSIGFGGMAKNIAKSISEKNKDNDAPGEEIAKGIE